MNNLLDIRTPAESVAQARRADYDLSNHGVSDLRLVYWNLAMEALYEEAIFRGEGVTVAGGPFVAHTGKHTGRSANDKFTVKQNDSENHIWWGTYNRPFDAAKFDALHTRMLGYLQSKDVFVQDVYVGADEKYRQPCSSSPIRRRVGSADKVVLPVPLNPKNKATSCVSFGSTLAEQCMDITPCKGSK